MRLRPYRVMDAECIGKWIDSEWVNAYWSANTLPYPFDAVIAGAVNVYLILNCLGTLNLVLFLN